MGKQTVKQFTQTKPADAVYTVVWWWSKTGKAFKYIDKQDASMACCDDGYAVLKLWYEIEPNHFVIIIDVDNREWIPE